MWLLDIFKKKDINYNSSYLYTDKEIKEYKKYITSQLGEIDYVFSEIVSDEIKLDVLIIAPTKENNYYKLVTMGMGAYKMNVPKELQKYQFDKSELVLYLPPDWDIKSKEDKNYWPIRQLKTLARLPIQSNSWLGTGHTISSDKKNSPFAINTKLCSILLLNTTNLKDEELELRLKSRKEINFYQLFPLYLEEMQYKFDFGTSKLLGLFSEKDLFPIVNIERKNYCEKIK